MPENHLLLYDGVCGLCNRLVRFVIRHDPAGVFHFSSLGSDESTAMLRRFGRDPSALDTFYVVAGYRSATPRLFSRARAALFLVGQIGGWWGVLRIFGVLPDFLLNLPYDLVARYRYRIFGRYDVCPVPPPEVAHRFIDR